MFQGVFSAGCWGSLQSIGAISQLATNYRQLVLIDSCLDTQSDPGFHAAMVCVQSLEEVAEALGLQQADRSYRANFSVNYRALFSDNSRNYRAEILRASLDRPDVIWVNGDKFEFSEEAKTRAEMVSQCWTDVGVALEKWNHSETRQSKLQLWSALTALDTAWAVFEHRYINELIDIEARPRKLIMTAVQHEQKLKDLETKHGHQKAAAMPEYMDTQRILVQNISHLNSVANARRKGRDDLSVEVLWDAMEAINSCDAAEQMGESTERLSAARILSEDVVASYLAMRNYFREISKQLDRVDPYLCHNVGLVRRLVDWEESWEVGKNSVQNPMILSGICDLVAEIWQAQLITPGFKSMCEDRDVELFMVLPRVLWLQGLAKPAVHLHVFKSLLPHRFSSTPKLSNISQEQWSCDSELKVLVEQFRSVCAQLVSSVRSGGRISDFSALEVLVKRVVNGSESQSREDIYGMLSPSARGQAEEAVEGFINKMEGWSMEIQRHCAEDWNMFASIIVKCLSGGGIRKDSNGSTFEV